MTLTLSFMSIMSLGLHLSETLVICWFIALGTTKVFDHSVTTLPRRLVVVHGVDAWDRRSIAYWGGNVFGDQRKPGSEDLDGQAQGSIQRKLSAVVVMRMHQLQRQHCIPCIYF